MKIGQRIRIKLSHFKRNVFYCFPFFRPKKVLFDHLPKCGGTTLNKYLEAHYPPGKIFSTHVSKSAESVRFFKALPVNTRYEYSLVKGHLTNELFDYADPKCIKITLIYFGFVCLYI
jgi:hypothetical protein